MKLLVSGPSNSGKTTICRYLSEEFNVSYLDEDFDEIIEVRKIFLAAARNMASRPDELKGLYSKVVAAYTGWINRRQKLYKENTSFVADRAEIDLMREIMAMESALCPEKLFQLLDRCIKSVSELVDYIIITHPFEDFERYNSSNMRRTQRNVISNKKYFLLNLGLAHQYFEAEKIIVIGCPRRDEKTTRNILMEKIAS